MYEELCIHIYNYIFTHIYKVAQGNQKSLWLEFKEE